MSGAACCGPTSSEFSAAESFPLLLLFFMLLLADLLVSCTHRRKEKVTFDGCMFQTLVALSKRFHLFLVTHVRKLYQTT